MKSSTITLAKLLTYSGTLPLIVSAILLCFPVAGIDGTLLAKTYSAVIISFLCGIHWAAYLFFAEKCPHNLLITSNITALLAWVSLIIPVSSIALILHIFCFLFLLMLDAKLHNAGILQEWFYTLRRNATLIVVLSLTTIIVLQ